MSIAKHIYLGPFLEVTVRIVETEKDNCKQPKDCPNPAVGFCSQCGIAAAGRFGCMQKEEPLVEVDRLIGDALSNNRGCTLPETVDMDGQTVRRYAYMPNRSGYQRRFRIGDIEDGVEDWSDLDVANERDWFCSTYIEAIANMREAFGFDNCKIKWGLVAWYS